MVSISRLSGSTRLTRVSLSRLQAQPERAAVRSRAAS
jgi:hypothetical protein